MPVLRFAALKFFQTDKYNAIVSNPENSELLEWIRDEVIGTRKTRAFLLPVGTEDEIIDRLFDRRALHILSRSMSAAHVPGERFIVYKLDTFNERHRIVHRAVQRSIPLTEEVESETQQKGQIVGLS